MFKALLEWSEAQFNHLPWRRKRSLYRTLVSEIMLQQTTVSTVLKHFERFLERFPDLESLALASEEDLLVAWKGLGYYRRARSLKKIAETLVSEHAGKFPKDLATLQTITGIGPYTANALVAIGMDRPAIAIDANLERVLARLFAVEVAKGPALQKYLAAQFVQGKLIPERDFSFRALNEALMDLGRTVCQANKASCEICLMKKSCLAFKSGRPLEFPTQAAEKKKAQEHELTLLRLVVEKEGKVLAYLKEDHEWLAGQWELPTFVVRSSDAKLQQYPAWGKELAEDKLVSFKTGITKYSILNLIDHSSEKAVRGKMRERQLQWRRLDDEKANLSTASLKALKKLGLL